MSKSHPPIIFTKIQKLTDKGNDRPRNYTVHSFILNIRIQIDPHLCRDLLRDRDDLDEPEAERDRFFSSGLAAGFPEVEFLKQVGTKYRVRINFSR